jgi:hypothetical protein
MIYVLSFTINYDLTGEPEKCNALMDKLKNNLQNGVSSVIISHNKGGTSEKNLFLILEVNKKDEDLSITNLIELGSIDKIDSKKLFTKLAKDNVYILPFQEVKDEICEILCKL